AAAARLGSDQEFFCLRRSIGNVRSALDPTLCCDLLFVSSADWDRRDGWSGRPCCAHARRRGGNAEARRRGGSASLSSRRACRSQPSQCGSLDGNGYGRGTCGALAIDQPRLPENSAAYLRSSQWTLIVVTRSALVVAVRGPWAWRLFGHQSRSIARRDH